MSSEVMKNKSGTDSTQKVFWKSLEEKNHSEEFKKVAEREFLSSPFATEDGNDEVARRDFLKLMGASIALASTACVRKPVDRIVPYAEHPPEITPGVANYYASSWAYAGQVTGLIVKTREGRPIKLEGNPGFPVNKNGLSAAAQAQILSLYDPDRLQSPVKVENGSAQKITWDQLDEAVTPELKKGSVVLLSSSLSSPSTKQLIGDFFQGFKGKHVVWDAIGADDVIEGQKASYGNSIVPRYRFDRAKMIVSFGADFLGSWLSPAEFSSQFAQNRKPSSEMNKLVVFESMMSLTGANSDTRIQVKPSQTLTAVMAILHELIVTQKASRYAGDGAIQKTLSQFSNAAADLGVDSALISQIAKDLWANKGQSLAVAGGLNTRTKDSLSLQVAVNFLNSVLENDGKTLDGSSVPVVSYEGSYAAIESLIAEMNRGDVHTLIIHRANPVYALADSFGFKEALKKVKLVIYTGGHFDETAKLAHYVAPDHHHLENWGDNESQEGVYAIQQPTVRPLYDTRSLELTFISWAYQLDAGPARLREPDSWLQYLQTNWRDLKNKLGLAGDFESFWTNFLRTGVVDTSSRNGKRSSNAPERKFLVNAFTSIQKPKSDTALELVLYTSVGLGDGSNSNNSWLQELPDPITKIVWDSYVSIAPQTAKTLGVKEGQVIEITAGGVTLKLPVHIQPGCHPGALAVAVGLGRTDAGSVGSGVGVNAFQFASNAVFAGIDAKVNVTSEKIELANTQGHHSMEGRQIVVQATLKDYLKKPDANIHKHKMLSLWPKHEYKGYRWAMVIDQSVCTGCSACVVACQSENNVPVVGKKHILDGREMHWIRIDRYYVGDESNPETVFQPMLCQHCENAPCETVCPVLATTHSDEGLNQMTYNRCVGTRYCANNCPYKVRRFNWFNYTTTLKKPEVYALNPDVTVRSRGVMEKCTFCVQRIHDAKGVAKDKGITVKDGDVKTACQESCPTNAIIFGNVNDKGALVAKTFDDPRAYSVLEEFNAVPMVKYQTKIRNSDAVQSDGKGAH